MTNFHIILYPIKSAIPKGLALHFQGRTLKKHPVRLTKTVPESVHDRKDEMDTIADVERYQDVVEAVAHFPPAKTQIFLRKHKNSRKHKYSRNVINCLANFSRVQILHCKWSCTQTWNLSKNLHMFSEKIYTAGNFFTWPPVVTVATNFKSGCTFQSNWALFVLVSGSWFLTLKVLPREQSCLVIFHMFSSDAIEEINLCQNCISF